MKHILLIIMISAMLFIGCSKDPGAYREADFSHNAGQTFIGARVALPVLEGYHNGKIQKIDLNRYKGWIILFFYPGNFTFVCPTELKELADFYDDFKEGGAEIFSISTDSAYVHRAWKNDSPHLRDVKFPMLSDRSGSFSRQMGVYQHNAGAAVRATFIIDPQRKIVSAEFSDDTIGRNTGELLRKFDAAVAVNKGGGMCPAGWTPGSDLITEE